MPLMMVMMVMMWWWRWRRLEGQVCVECVRLFGCLHSWAAVVRGRTSHNDTQTSFALSHDKIKKIDRDWLRIVCIKIDSSAFQHWFGLEAICAWDRKRSLFECLWKLVKISQNFYSRVEVRRPFKRCEVVARCWQRQGSSPSTQPTLSLLRSNITRWWKCLFFKSNWDPM